MYNFRDATDQKKKKIKVIQNIYKTRNQTCIALFIRYFLTVVLKSLKTTEFPSAEGDELKTLEALCWKVPDSRGTFNVVYFKDLSVRVGL